MRLVYVLLSPTYGMHQYTADLANRMADDGHDVHLVTTRHLPRDRYAPNVAITTPISTTSTGLSLETLRLGDLRTTFETVRALRPDVVHFTGPHLWNVPVIRALKRSNLPIVHTLHDLDPHAGTRFGALLGLWNRAILALADHILVHGRVYHDRLLQHGLPPDRVTHTPLLHLFLDHAHTAELTAAPPPPVTYEPMALFFGRLEPYKGLDDLLDAFTHLADMGAHDAARLVLAGRGTVDSVWHGRVPLNVTHHAGLIDDAQALDLFRRCGLIVLPYTDATQSAVVAAGYFFQKPVLVARSGALPEYVVDGETGFVVEPRDPAGLAAVVGAALSDPARLRALGQAGRDWLDVQRPCEHRALLDLYQRAAGRSAVVRALSPTAPTLPLD